MLAADLTERTVDAPPDRWCSSGHHVPDNAQYQGNPTRFFRVSGKGVSGVYCEPCLVIAHYMAQKGKHGTRR